MPTPALPLPSRRRRHAIARSAMALLAVAAALQAPAPVRAAIDPAQREQADAAFRRATAGDESAIESAAERWVALAGAEPGNPIAQAYAGSATTLRALTTWMPWRKMAHVEDGLARIDKALALLSPAHEQAPPRAVPPALETRFVAASTWLALPSMFNRGERGALLLAKVLADPLLPPSALEFRASVWLAAGQQAMRQGDSAAARRWLQAAADAARDASANAATAAAAGQAARLLAGLQ